MFQQKVCQIKPRPTLVHLSIYQ